MISLIYTYQIDVDKTSFIFRDEKVPQYLNKLEDENDNMRNYFNPNKVGQKISPGSVPNPFNSQIYIFTRQILKFSRQQEKVIRSMMPMRRILRLSLCTSITHQCLKSRWCRLSLEARESVNWLLPRLSVQLNRFPSVNVIPIYNSDYIGPID